MDWAAWGPTVVTVVAWVFFAGAMWSNQKDHTKRLDAHDLQLEEHTRDITENALDIREL